MVSAIDSAKRVLVALLKSIAAVYSLTLSLTRESTEAEIRSAFRKVSKKAHPDHGGKKEHQTALNGARDTWEDATKAGKGKHGGERRDGPLLPTQARRQNDAGFRFQSLGVLLTYQKFADTGPWDAFLEFVRGHLEHWRVRYWCATMETNADGTRHLHLMLQFFRAGDRKVDAFRS
jgi:curved DNA-binding protein CbpA